MKKKKEKTTNTAEPQAVVEALGAEGLAMTRKSVAKVGALVMTVILPWEAKMMAAVQRTKTTVWGHGLRAVPADPFPQDYSMVVLLLLNRMRQLLESDRGSLRLVAMV